jgi:pyruvate formate lyase activating enzyme
VRVCPSSAMVQLGNIMSARSVVDVVERDKVFYEKSSGGVTLSGGEVTQQPAFATEILRLSQERGINTAIETCGFASWDVMTTVLKYTDLVLFDVKLVNDEKHKRYTGVSNSLIIDNLRRISELGMDLIVRVPVIPGCNDYEEDLNDVIELVASLTKVSAIHLLPYELFGITKYDRLGREYVVGETPPPSEERMKELGALFSKRLSNVQIGG